MRRQTGRQACRQAGRHAGTQASWRLAGWGRGGQKLIDVIWHFTNSSNKINRVTQEHKLDSLVDSKNNGTVNNSQEK